MNLEITEQDKQTILAIVSGLPPEDWLHQCRTKTQRQHWQEVRTSFHAIYYELESHFLGKPSPAKIGDRNAEELVALATLRYLDLYEIVRHGWYYLLEFAEKHGFDLPASPGTYLIAILNQDCEAMFNQCLAYYEFNPRKIEELCRLETKIMRGKASDREKRKYDQGIQKLAASFHTIPLSVLLIGVCGVHKAANAGLSEAFSRHSATQAKLRAITTRSYHPRMGERSYSWNNGQKQLIYKT